MEILHRNLEEAGDRERYPVDRKVVECGRDHAEEMRFRRYRLMPLNPLLFWKIIQESGRLF